MPACAGIGEPKVVRDGGAQDRPLPAEGGQAAGRTAERHRDRDASRGANAVAAARQRQRGVGEFPAEGGDARRLHQREREDRICRMPARERRRGGDGVADCGVEFRDGYLGA